MYQVTVVPVLTSKKWGNKDLPLKPGEIIDAITKPVDNKLIGRNQDGKCKWSRDIMYVYPYHFIYHKKSIGNTFI